MNINGSLSAFVFRPPGILSTSVALEAKPRLKPVDAFQNQEMIRLAQGIDPNAIDPEKLLDEYPAELIFFFSLENAYFLVGPEMDGVILTDDRHLISESTYYCLKPDTIASKVPNTPAVQMDEVFIAFDPLWMRYDHWMGYNLSKAFLANESIPKEVPIVMPKYRPSQHDNFNAISEERYEESLEKAGLGKRITRLEDGIYQAKKLYFFWPTSYYPHYYYNFKNASDVFKHLKKELKYNNKLPPRFYIEPDEKNFILTEDEKKVINATLNDLNVTPVRLDKMDWQSQISLFSQAELIICTHQPELINLFFCLQEAEILELTRSFGDKTYLEAWPYMISSLQKLSYSFLDLDWTKLTPNVLKEAVKRLDIL